MVMNKIRDLVAKVEFWYAKKYIKVDTHYTFFLDLNSEPGSFAVKYLKKYDGVIVEFSNVNITDDGLLTFDHDVISNVNNCDVQSKRFGRFTSNVMRNIIFSAIDNAMKEENENRKSDFVELDSERDLHEEGVTISEERVSDRKPRKKTIRANKGVRPQV